MGQLKAHGPLLANFWLWKDDSQILSLFGMVFDRSGFGFECQTYLSNHGKRIKS